MNRGRRAGQGHPSRSARVWRRARCSPRRHPPPRLAFLPRASGRLAGDPKPTESMTLPTRYPPGRSVPGPRPGSSEAVGRSAAGHADRVAPNPSVGGVSPGRAHVLVCGNGEGGKARSGPRSRLHGTRWRRNRPVGPSRWTQAVGNPRLGLSGPHSAPGKGSVGRPRVRRRSEPQAAGSMRRTTA